MKTTPLTILRRQLARSGEEGGFIMVIVMLVMVIGLAAGAAAMTEAIASRSSSDRNARSARALQAADAGIQAEIYRANQLNLGSLYLTKGASLATIISQLLTCPVPQTNASGQIAGITFIGQASVGNPCPANSASGTTSPPADAEPIGHHDYFDVRFIPGTTAIGDFIDLSPKIVAAGIDNNGSNTVTRRVEAILAPIAPWRTLEATHNVTITVPPALSALGIKLAGATVFNGTAAAGNLLSITGTALLANAFTASNVSLSGGITEPSALDSCLTPTETNVTATVVLGHITGVGSGCGLVNRSAITLSSSKANCAPATGTVACSTLFTSHFSVGGDSFFCTSACPTLTFQPGDYVFCDFQWAGYVNFNSSTSSPVRIFIDNPSSSRCSGYTAPTGQSAPFQNFGGNFIATKGVNNVLGVAHPSQAQVYLVGDSTSGHTVAYTTGDSTLSSQAMFMYAPKSTVTVNGGQTCVLGTCVDAGTIAGAFIGYDVNASATAVTEDIGLLNYPLSGTLGPFYVKQYIECAPSYPLPTPDPTSGC
jgi:hypothetical protein